MVRKKHKCDCGKMATYLYMPGFGNGANSHICDDCISSADDIGCSCNFYYTTGDLAEQPEGIEGKDWRWVIHEGDEYRTKITKEDGIWVRLDERGRPYACVEYDYSETGYDVPTLFDKFIWYFRWKWILLKPRLKDWWRKHFVAEMPQDMDI